MPGIETGPSHCAARSIGDAMRHTCVHPRSTTRFIAVICDDMGPASSANDPVAVRDSSTWWPGRTCTAQCGTRGLRSASVGIRAGPEDRSRRSIPVVQC
jgi:hypothetical protein